MTGKKPSSEKCGSSAANEPIVQQSMTAPEVAAAVSDCMEAQATERSPFAGELAAVFSTVKAWTGHDFSSYKTSTVMRRIERRMAVNDIAGIGQYSALLHENPQEAQALCQDILIGVTSFFRDGEAFAALRREVIPRLLADRPAGEPLRVWHACCATGEEVYSMAMLIMEYLREQKLATKVVIFATDIDEVAIAQARAGRYDDDIRQDVGEERLNTFFTRVDGSWQVIKSLREMVVFAHHSLIKDPPFSRLDLLVCRNFLIYLNSDMQKRLIALFHQVLTPGGFLFLGSAETVGGNGELFAPVVKKWKIFSRLERVRRSEVLFPLASPVRRSPGMGRPVRPAEFLEPTPGEAAEKVLMLRYSPPCVVVNEKYEVVHVSNRTNPLLEVPVGEPTRDILRMAREELRPALRSAIYKAFTEQRQVVFRGVKVGADGRETTVNVLVEPLGSPFSAGKLAMVVFEPAPQAAPPSLAGSDMALGAEASKEMLIRQLEEQLRITHEQLQATTEQLETSHEGFLSANEELMSINEEFQSANEELQSSNEELETSKEELHALNEELSTVNAELHGKVEELNQANNDVENLFTSSEVATLFLDREFRIKRYTPAMAPILNLVPAHIGRSLHCLSGILDSSALARDAETVLEKLLPIEREVRIMADDRHYFSRILPYKTGERKVDGIVFTLVNISELKRMEERTLHLASFPQLNPNPVLEVDCSGTITFSNPATQRILDNLGLQGENAAVFLPPDMDTILEDWDRRQEAALFREIVLQERQFGETIFLTPQFKVARIYAYEITERKRAEEALRESEECVRRKLDCILTPEGDIGNLDLADIIDAQAMQSLMNNFYKLSSMPMGMIDLKGRVLVGVGWQDICTKFHRVHPETCKNCNESDSLLTEGVPKGEYKLYKCKNNMWDVATPIMVGGRKFGNFFMGQFFLEDEPLNYELFRSQARQYGFDERNYIAALERVPRLSRESLDTGMSYFMELADMISRMSYSNLKLARSLSERDALMGSLRESYARLNLLADATSELLRSDSPQQIVEELCRKVMSFLDCQAFFNFLVDDNQGRLHLNACAGIAPEEAKKIEWLDYGVAICGCAARDACRIVAGDIRNTPDPRTDLVKSYGIQAYACHPLMVQGRLLGTLSFGTCTRTQFTDDELALMKAVADQVAIAMEHKRTQEVLRRAHDELELRVRERTEELAATVGTLRGEIAERQRAEENLRRLNRLYAVLCEIDQAIVRAADRDSLFRDFCRIAVDLGGFLLSWVGLMDENGSQVRMVAASGATAYLEDIEITAVEEPLGGGPTGISIREGTYYICNDFQHDPCTQPWHDKGRTYGIRASASVALKEEERVVGTLTLYAGEKDFFDEQHVALLRQMGADISYALGNFKREARRREAEQALQAETAERLQAVEQLCHKEQLLMQQSRQAAMGEMIGNIAHQWRQPLNALGLIIQQLGLSYECGNFSKAQLDTSIDKVMEIISHMSQTIDDFRNFYRPDKKKDWFKVNRIVAKTVSLIEANFREHRIAVEITAADDLEARGYPNEYAQVLLNILMNARDAFLERGVDKARVLVCLRQEGQRTVLSVSDTAGGIDEEIMDRIFDPYFTTKSQGLGTGIGLFMAKNIIEQNMGGRLTARNVDGGAEFRIEI